MYKFFISFIFLSALLFSQSKNHILFKGATAHLGNGQVIENSYVSFKGNKFDLVSDANSTKIDLTVFDTIIDVTNKHIYPGLIAPNSILGLVEAESIRATSDYVETGEYNPHIRSLIAYNTDSKLLESVRCNGVMYVQSVPRYGVISGKSSIFATEGDNWEDAVIMEDDGIHLIFPKTNLVIGAWPEPINIDKNKVYNEQLDELTTFFENALAYYNTPNVEEKNLRFEAMRCVFNGHCNLYIHADYIKDLLLAINFVKRFSVPKTVLVGAMDSYKITKLLKENHISVMLNRLHNLPSSPENDVDLNYKLPYLLQKDSVLFCLQNEGDMDAMNVRNLAFLAGTAAAYGLTNEQALQSITLNSAKILGIDKLVGSIESEKLASFIISEGNILDMKTSKLTSAYINGKTVNLNNFQFDLYRKYSKKFNLGN